MLLGSYLIENKERPAAFAGRIKRKRLSIYRYTLPPNHPEYRIPNRATMISIYIATGGRVGPGDFYDLPDLAAAQGPAPRAAG